MQVRIHTTAFRAAAAFLAASVVCIAFVRETAAFGDPEFGGRRVRAERPSDDVLFLPDPYLDPSWPELDDDVPPDLMGEGTGDNVLDVPLDPEHDKAQKAEQAAQEEARKAIEEFAEPGTLDDERVDDPLPSDSVGIGKEYGDPVEW